MKIVNQSAQAISIQHLWEKGIRDAAEIQRRTNLPRSTIYYNISKLKKTGTTVHKKRSGRPKKITPEASNAIGQIVRRNPTISTRTLANKIIQKGVYVSHVTISQHLANHGFKKKLPLATPMLTKAHKAKRVEWARNHINDNWNKTLFTDETSFWLFRNTVERWYKGTRPVRRIPKDRTRINAWGGICIKGKTSLHCFRDNMTGASYVDIIREHLPEVDELFGKRWRFLQDNDPKHTSKIAKEFLQANVPTIVDWPSNSPDINPIENLWSIIKRGVEIRQPQNIEELDRFMVEEWEKVSKSIIVNLIMSMSERCQLVIDCKGERIPY